ncbi:unnamed protein product [Spirodela intermedia]|uniref:Uncharacterized protein n=1 Tax=Spirodela intermedia TaxID=51605 RepID=A0A7I8I9A8_SPIIN|nr:unnamed protein product [Spirodela intermedia]CAA6653652.1 unnamed protein product [Spirodela intermedia]
MVKYSREPGNPTKSAKAMGQDLRVHFKRNRARHQEAALGKAKRYLEDVIAHKQAIPFTRFCGGGRWPAKSAKFILDLLKNAESNAEVKGLDVDTLYISHIQVNQARNRDAGPTALMGGSTVTYMSSPCHIELVLSEKEEAVQKEPETQLATRKPKKSSALRSGASS